MNYLWYNPNVPFLEIVFVKGSTCVNIYAFYDATYEDEAEVMSLIDSINLWE